jgi:hypothetical protein
MLLQGSRPRLSSGASPSRRCHAADATPIFLLNANLKNLWHETLDWIKKNTDQARKIL